MLADLITTEERTAKGLCQECHMGEFLWSQEARWALERKTGKATEHLHAFLIIWLRCLLSDKKGGPVPARGPGSGPTEPVGKQTLTTR